MTSSAVLADAATFGDLLRLLRRRMGLTQSELAALVGFSVAQISRLEKNDRLPDLTMVAEKFVPALELAEEPRLAQRLLTLAATARGERPPQVAIASNTLEITVHEEIVEEPAHLNLPPTALIGREQEVVTIGQRLLDAPGRLLTLVGPPGVGKTRLAQAVATQVRDLFADGVYFIPLAALTNPEQLAAAIATNLGLAETGRKPPLVRLIEQLRRKEILCLLDNFEQLLPSAVTATLGESKLTIESRAGVHIVAELLAQCSGVRLLVTSRSALRLRAEQRYKVAPISPAAAVELFLQRAQAIDPDFPMTATTLTDAATICLRLDCLPLAIELLAARVDILTPQQMLDQLQDSRLDLLNDGPHDLPEHQRTLRNAIHRSYVLLDAHEQRCFRTLSVFANGWTETALAAVLYIDNAPIERSEAEGQGTEVAPPFLRTLQSLVTKNLVQLQVQEGSSRYLLLETLREYGAEQLMAQQEATAARTHHTDYYFILAQQAATEMHGHTKKIWLDTLEQEHDNLRVALQWLLTQDAARGLALTVALEEFWATRGHDSEARRWLDQALKSDQAPSPTRAAALVAAANFARHQADYTAAEELLHEGLAIYRTQADLPGIAHALRHAGWLAYDRHELTQTLAHFNESLTCYRQLEESAGIADLLLCLVHVLRGQAGQQETVTHYLQESLHIYRTLDRPEGIAQALQQQGETEVAAGNYAVASRLFTEVLAQWRALGAKMHIAWTLELIGECAWLQDDLPQAQRSYEEALPLFTELDNKDGLMITLHHLAQVARRKGDLTAAQTSYQQSLELAQTLDNRHMLARCFAGIGGVACAAGEFARAAPLLAAAQAIFTQLPPFLAPPDQTEYKEMIAATRRVLGEECFAHSWQAELDLML